jgi:LysM repeat protein
MSIKFPLALVTALSFVFAIGEETYTVKPGDTLSQISQRFGVPYTDIVEANSLNGSSLFNGQVLTIPSQKLSVQKTISTLDKIVPPPINRPGDRYRIPANLEEPIPPVTSVLPTVVVKSVPQPPTTSYARIPAPTFPGYGVSPYNNQGSRPQTANATPKLPSKTVPASQKKGRTYIVQPGDSVLGISKEFSVNPWALRTANGIQFKRIYPGQILRIP